MRSPRLVSASAFVIAVLLVSSGFAVASPPTGAGSAEKATGDVAWERAGTYRTAVFDAHEEMGNRSAKGSLTQTHYSEVGGTLLGYFTVDVGEVKVDGNWACFGGFITEAAGIFDGRVGNYRVSVAIDGGEPAFGVDAFGGNDNVEFNDTECMRIKGDVASNTAVDGNVQVHSND